MSAFNQIKCELAAAEPAQMLCLSREVAIEVCLRYDRLRAINAELLAALEHVKRWADDATQSTRLDWNRVEAAIAKAKGATP